MTKNITEWLDKTAARFPEGLALHDEQEELTYQEYRIKALGIARSIIEKNIRHEPVIVYLEKGVNIPVSFFGIAYSGNFYSPVDTALPKARVSVMLSVLQPKLAITRRSLSWVLDDAGYRGERLFIEDICPAEDDEAVVASVLSGAGGEDLLYVLFTSGSTGIPKGVSITHRSVINYIEWADSVFSFTERDSFGNQAPFYFDNSILDIYCAAKSGATLYIIPKHLFAQPVPLLSYLKEHRITTIFWVPSALIVPAKLHAFRNVDLTSCLKRVLFCGEVMPARQLSLWRAYLPDVCYANLYGPTEITDACAYYIIDREFADYEPVPIGKPIRGVEMYLITEEDGKIRRVSKGASGEICVAGVCLSPGYYQNPEKTREVFVPNPFGSGLMYKTGDIGRYNARGELEYLSRKDFQIKHLGHRIELGEIETAADSVAGVSRSCALYDAVRHKIVLFAETGISSSFIEESLAHLLPAYMMPSKIIIMDEIPINCNGKIDRTLLQEYIT
ncbi:MAG: amino acid adenylation domain-containing protein [Methanocorpusculum sp.]|nr:amino acid adenylation domain-containing protein [Methanocorpusculum sp.]